MEPPDEREAIANVDAALLQPARSKLDDGASAERRGEPPWTQVVDQADDAPLPVNEGDINRETHPHRMNRRCTER